LERQHLLEKTQRTQKRFIQLTTVALVLMIILVAWAYNEKKAASASEIKAVKNEIKTKMALLEIKKQQAVAKATELKSFGDSYRDLGKSDFACASYRAGLIRLENYKTEPLYVQLKQKVDSCK
jgi:hypothetical protein